ncbi:MAG: DciA family protein [Planctomycetota bacterium]|jgi:hypothetical protein
MTNNQNISLLNRWHKPNRRFANTSTKLGKSMKELLDRQIAPKHNKLAPAINLWQQLLPAELEKHCRIIEISTGEISVQVDSPSYRHELMLCGPEIIEHINHECPKVNIKRIKFVIDQLQ